MEIKAPHRGPPPFPHLPPGSSHTLVVYVKTRHGVASIVIPSCLHHFIKISYQPYVIIPLSASLSLFSSIKMLIRDSRPRPLSFARNYDSVSFPLAGGCPGAAATFWSALLPGGSYRATRENTVLDRLIGE